MFKSPAKRPAPEAEKPFAPDGQVAPDGSVRYKVACDGGINPSGVFWSKTVAPGASADDYRAAQKERDQAIEQLARLNAPGE